MDLRGSLRLFRAILLTGVATSVAAAGHVLAGGALPEPQILALLAALLLAPAGWLARRQLSFLTLLGVLGSGQVVLHQAFMVLSSPVLCPTPWADPMMHHGSAPSMDCFLAVPASPPIQTVDDADSLGMLAAHVMALLATAWLLRKGEVALWQLLAWLRPLVQLPRSAWNVPVRQRPAAAALVFAPAPRRNLCPDNVRGPPATAARCAAP